MSLDRPDFEDDLDIAAMNVAENCYKIVETFFEERGRFKQESKAVAAMLDGPVQKKFVENPAQTAREIDNYVSLLEQKSGNENIQSFEAVINNMDSNAFRKLLGMMVSLILGTAEALMKRNNKDVKPGEKENLPSNMIAADLAHYKEVIALDMEIVMNSSLDQADKFRAVVAAAVHDMAKYSQRLDGPGKEVRPHRGDFPDNMYSVFNHEILSAAAAVELGKAEAFKKLLPVDDAVREEWFKIVAATAAGHGKGEFPEKLQRERLAPPSGIPHDYYAVRLLDTDPAATIVHQADMISGQCGYNGITREYGGSYKKYIAGGAPKNKEGKFFTLEEYFTPSQCPVSPIGSTLFYQTEIDRSLVAATTTSADMKEKLRKLSANHCSAAIVFKDWALALSPDDPDRAVFDNKDPNVTNIQRRDAYNRLLDRANASGNPSENIFTPETMAAAYESYKKEIIGYVRALYGFLNGFCLEGGTLAVPEGTEEQLIREAEAEMEAARREGKDPEKALNKAKAAHCSRKIRELRKIYGNAIPQ